MTETTLVHLEDVCPKRGRHIIYQLRTRPTKFGLVDLVAYTGRPGRVGFPLTIEPDVTEADAASIAARIAKSKIRDGYADPAKPETSKAVFDDMLPALLTPLHSPETYDFSGADWLVQRKHDGVNRPIRLTASGPEFFNRDAQRAAGNAAAVDDLVELHDRIGDAVLFCEDMGPRGIEIFDVMDVIGSYRDDPFLVRNEALKRLKGICRDLKSLHVNVAVPLQDFLGVSGPERLKAIGAEGYVLKRADATHKPGRSRSTAAAWMMKVKFVADATFRVSGHDEGGRRVIEVQTMGPDGWTHAGRVFVPESRDMPDLGSFVDVQYLYASAAGVISQPVFKGPRPDATAADCDISKLKIKAT